MQWYLEVTLKTFGQSIRYIIFFMIFNVYVYGCIRSIHKWSSKVHVCKDVPLAWMCREILWRFECSKVLKLPLLNCSWVSWRYTAQSYSTQSCSKRQSLRPFESTKFAWSNSGISRAQNARGAKLNWQIYFIFFFWSSRLPSLVFAAKISHLLHFVAKISHSHCSSIFRLVSGFFQLFLSSFPSFSLFCPWFASVFPWCSSIFPWMSSIFPWFSSIFPLFSSLFICFLQFFHGFLQFFYGFLQFFYGFLQFFHGFHSPSLFHLFSFMVPEFSLICTWFSWFFRSFHLFLEMPDVQNINCRCKEVYIHD